MIKLFKRSEERWKDNEFARLFFFVPASLISGILVVPMTIISLPLTLFKNNTQRNIMKFLLRLTHSISLSFWYFIADFYGFDFEFVFSIPLPVYVEYSILIGGTYFAWKNTINNLVQETLDKYFTL